MSQRAWRGIHGGVNVETKIIVNCGCTSMTFVGEQFKKRRTNEEVDGILESFH